jgi:hypothetical protein
MALDSQGGALRRLPWALLRNAFGVKAKIKNRSTLIKRIERSLETVSPFDGANRIRF